MKSGESLVFGAFGHWRRRLARFGFHLLYNRLAFLYDGISWLVSLGRWRCWQRAVMPYLPPAGLMVELGHGAGGLQVDLLDAGYQTIAFDLSPYMGRLAARKLARRGLHTDFVRGDARQLPFMSASIATIVCTFPTDFILASDTLSEIQRVLSEGGQCIIVLAGRLQGGGLARRLIKGLYRLIGQRDAAAAQTPMHSRFADRGFSVETAEARCQDSIAQLVILTKN